MKVSAVLLILLQTEVWAAFEWRNKNGWCGEARKSPLELIETCYADDQCCQKSSQCSNGCCGEDFLCHVQCFSKEGRNFHGAEITQIEYSVLQKRPDCRKLIYNVQDTARDMIRLAMNLTTAVISLMLIICGCIMCLRQRNRDQKERKQIKLALKKQKRIMKRLEKRGDNLHPLMLGVPIGLPNQELSGNESHLGIVDSATKMNQADRVNF